MKSLGKNFRLSIYKATFLVFFPECHLKIEMALDILNSGVKSYKYKK